MGWPPSRPAPRHRSRLPPERQVWTSCPPAPRRPRTSARTIHRGPGGSAIGRSGGLIWREPRHLWNGIQVRFRFLARLLDEPVMVRVRRLPPRPLVVAISIGLLLTSGFTPTPLAAGASATAPAAAFAATTTPLATTSGGITVQASRVPYFHHIYL